MNRWWCIWSNAWCGSVWCWWWGWGWWWWSRLISSASESVVFIRWSSVKVIACVLTCFSRNKTKPLAGVREEEKRWHTCLFRWSLRIKRLPQTWHANRFSPRREEEKHFLFQSNDLYHHEKGVNEDYRSHNRKWGKTNLSASFFFFWLIDVFLCRLLTYDHLYLSLSLCVSMFIYITHEWFIPHK